MKLPNNMRYSRARNWAIYGVVALLLVLGYRHFLATPGAKFERRMFFLETSCRLNPPEKHDTRCDLLKVKIDDPLSTPEGRFAHAIQLPDPLPEDSGYRWWMTPAQYFSHLCEHEAGEFIYKTVDNVEGIYQIRAREQVNGYKLQHLYALEDPYGYVHHQKLVSGFVSPTRYRYFEYPAFEYRWNPNLKRYRNPSLYEQGKPSDVIERYFGDARNLRNLKKEFDALPQSRYGFTWRGIIRPHDREMGIAGGELIALDLKTNEVLGVRRGFSFYRGSWELTAACPKYGYEGGFDKSWSFQYWFLGKVLRPKNWKQSYDDLEATRIPRK